MHVLASVMVGLVAALHVYFLVLEMFFWRRPLGLRVFRQTQERAEISATLAANQGLYNGFLAAGLVWSLVTPGPEAHAFRWFFLGCVIVAGAYGAATVSPRIFFVQALPAIVALALSW